MRPAIFLVPFALAACGSRSSRSGGNDSGDVHISVASKGQSGDRVAVNVPGFNASVNLPGFDIGGNMDLDGVKLAPDTSVKAVDVNGDDKGDGRGEDRGSVRIRFTNPAAPAKLTDYYRGALAGAGFALAGKSGDSALTATKADKTFALALTPDGSGSQGTLTIAGD